MEFGSTRNYHYTTKQYKNLKCVTYYLDDGLAWYNILYYNDWLSGAGFAAKDLDWLMQKNGIPAEEKVNLFYRVNGSKVKITKENENGI